MVIADLYVLCLGQVKKSKVLIKDARIDRLRTFGLDKKVFFVDRYKALRKKKGIWYQVYPKARDRGDYYSEFFDISRVGDRIKVVFLREDIRNELADLVAKLYDDSPLKKLYFFVDLQGYKENKVTVNCDTFLAFLREEEIYFNTVYEIT